VNQDSPANQPPRGEIKKWRGFAEVQIHVKKVPREAAKYLGKYLGSTKVRDIRVESRWVDTYRLLSQFIDRFKSKPWHMRIRITRTLLYQPEMMEALQIGKPLDLSNYKRRGHSGKVPWKKRTMALSDVWSWKSDKSVHDLSC
jgi:hypothetical protein